MSKAKNILEFLSEQRTPLGVSLKNATYWEVKDVDDKIIVKLNVYGVTLLKFTYDKTTKELAQDTDGVNIGLFVAELKSRLHLKLY